jgi:hypothetical protein
MAAMCRGGLILRRYRCCLTNSFLDRGLRGCDGRLRRERRALSLRFDPSMRPCGEPCKSCCNLGLISSQGRRLMRPLQQCSQLHLIVVESGRFWVSQFDSTLRPAAVVLAGRVVPVGREWSSFGQSLTGLPNDSRMAKRLHLAQISRHFPALCRETGQTSCKSASDRKSGPIRLHC